MSATKQPISFKDALKFLKAGKVVALPTETVYGLGASIYSSKGLKKIFQIKKRPFFDPLIVHCYDIEQAESLTVGNIFPAKELWSRFSPGPLTLVLPKSKKVSSLITAGKNTVALRIPAHPLMRNILKELGAPIAAPSANLFGQTSPTRASHLLKAFNGRIPVLNGGNSTIGLESTIIRPDPKKRQILILRPGSISHDDLKKFLSEKKIFWNVIEANKKTPHPGSFAKHYAPAVPLIIVESAKPLKTLQLKLNKQFPKKKIKFLKISPSPYITARYLYHQMQTLSKKKENLICVQKNPVSKYQQSCWPAIWNRLEKASSHKIII